MSGAKGTNIMEEINASPKAYDGLLRIGYVANLRNGTYLKELQDVLSGTDQEPTSQEIRNRANSAEILSLNWSGYTTDSKGRQVTERWVKFKAFDTGYTSISGEAVYGWFEKDANTGKFTGVSWGTLKELRAYGSIRKTMERSFKMGDFYFENIDACEEFLEDIANSTIPESWKFKNKQSVLKHPILKMYLETIFVKLKKEGKVLKSADGKYIMFNTNLLDKFFHALYIIAEVKQADDLEVYLNPIRTAEESYSTLRRYGFEGQHPEPPVFFEDVNEVIFNTSSEWRIDKDYNSLSHIIETRIERFPQHMRDKSPDLLARKLYDAIDFALAIAQRNYKYIVPIYYPRFDNISFLMPIFLDGAYSASPDFALVLQTDRENKLYIARTILDLEAGYQDARLIAKPDESWLNPITLK